MKNKYFLPYRVDTYRNGILICSEHFCTLDSARVYMKAWCCHDEQEPTKHELIREAKP